MPAERAGVSDAPLNLLLNVPIAVLKSICHHAFGLAAIVHSDDVSGMTIRDYYSHCLLKVRHRC